MRVRYILPVLAIFVVLAGCGVPGVVAAGNSLPTPAATLTATPLPKLLLPNDEAPHRNLTEWWYYTGHFQGKDASGVAHDYGFELTFFQVLRGNFAPIYVGHYAVTDLSRGEFHFDQRLLTEPNAVLPNGTTTTGFDLAINDWKVKGSQGHDHLVANETDYAIDLALDTNLPAALHNGNGLLTYGLVGFSYYYSRPNMAVTGTIVDHGATIPVTGEAWMDHQWGDFLSTAGGGWDWFSVQLADHREYMIYFIRDANGKIVSTVGTRIDANGQTTDLAADQIAQQVTNHWRSPTTQVNYSAGWLLTVPGGTLTITPQLANQELVTTNTTGNIYWEGACNVTGTLDGQSVAGDGYTELTGYQS